MASLKIIHFIDDDKTEKKVFLERKGKQRWEWYSEINQPTGVWALTEEDAIQRGTGSWGQRGGFGIEERAGNHRLGISIAIVGVLAILCISGIWAFIAMNRSKAGQDDKIANKHSVARVIPGGKNESTKTETEKDLREEPAGAKTDPKSIVPPAASPGPLVNAEKKSSVPSREVAKASAKTGLNLNGATVASSFSISGGDTGLKDVKSIGTETASDGADYIVTTGEALEAVLDSGDFTVISAGTVQARSDTSITIEFADRSTRTWQIAEGTSVCDGRGQSIDLKQLVEGSNVAVRWKASNRKAFHEPSPGLALSIRLGGMLYKITEANGEIIDPKLADHACGKGR